MPEFSFRTREESLKRFRSEVFDLLVVGGGITGAAVARDASSRGLKVALIEKRDFAWGTSSRSSKLIHGGLRYLENFEFGLVFEALSERTLLLKTVPHMVRPLPFYFPVYHGDRNGRGILGLGLWLYDLLALFRAPGFHRSFGKKGMLREIPILKEEGLLGGFRYYDASMWDDVLAIQVIRSAAEMGAAVANYVEAVQPIFEGSRVAGFIARDREGNGEDISLRAQKTVICAGPWTDEVGFQLSPKWKHWLKPSKGVHLVFDLKRIPIPGAITMSENDSERIIFMIPRPDYGSGVVIVGTTDGPTPGPAERAQVDRADVEYLLAMVNKYFPRLQVKASDILSAYVGVRPLMDPGAGSGEKLQKVSREHHIDLGPGGTVVVAGGKYTTHRRMGKEIVDFALKTWREDHRKGVISADVPKHGPSRTRTPINTHAIPAAIAAAEARASARGLEIPPELYSRFGEDALELAESGPSSQPDPLGFPSLEAQLRHTIRTEMALHLEDFFLRRSPLYLARADHGEPWMEALAWVWAEERGIDPTLVSAEITGLRAVLAELSRWKEKL